LKLAFIPSEGSSGEGEGEGAGAGAGGAPAFADGVAGRGIWGWAPDRPPSNPAMADANAAENVRLSIVIS
jgi:hypothetical protein